MVKRVNARILVVLLAFFCPISHSFESFRGPTFSNSSHIEVDVSVMSDGKTQEVLHAFPAQQLIAMPQELQVQTVIVVAGQRRYELREREYTKQSNGLSQRRQLWIFDGQRICVVDISLMKNKSYIPICAGEEVVR